VHVAMPLNTPTPGAARLSVCDDTNPGAWDDKCGTLPLQDMSCHALSCTTMTPLAGTNMLAQVSPR